MRKAVFITLGVLAVVVIALCVTIASQPTDFKIRRSTEMDAPPSAVFAQVNDFHNWQAWSPWAARDPKAKNEFSGPEAGEGAKFKWSGNSEVGEGQMTLEESKPNEEIKIKLDFIRPMESTCDVVFAFDNHGDHTDVAWTMTGKRSFVEKAFCLVMDMDKMVGGDFDKGLASLKKIVESEPEPKPTDAIQADATPVETAPSEAPAADEKKPE